MCYGARSGANARAGHPAKLVKGQEELYRVRSSVSEKGRLERFN